MSYYDKYIKYKIKYNKLQNSLKGGTYNYNLDKVKKWEKNCYSQRATLPQFTDIANKRLSLLENININLSSLFI